MAIIQISKIQQRSGNVVDLPQLDEAELGFASDVKRLFIGKTTGDIENIEVLTSYADISFNQISGANSNLAILSPINGQVLTFNGNAWVNRGGVAAGLITLGTASNVRIDGGTNGYVLQTDGLGNLTWTAQSGSPGVGTPGGANTQVQFNDSSVFGGDAGLTFNKTTGIMTVSGTANIAAITCGNITPTSNIIYNLGTPTNRFKDLYLANSTIYLGAQTLSSNATATIISGVIYGNGAGLTSITATTAGTVTTAAQPNITSVGTLSSLSVTANITAGGIKTDGYYYANGASFGGTYSNANVAAYLPTYTGQVGTGAAIFYGTTLTTGANITAGTITGNWTLSSGSKLQATYADLAEYYAADAFYAPGTVLEFGGVAEVTLAEDETKRVAGVVSENPAYVMNSLCSGGYPTVIALQGRVPCKVRGNIRKGDLLVSGGGGFARPTTDPKIGTIIGKAIENFNDIEGVIEVAVGRL